LNCSQHWHDNVYWARYTRWSELVFKQIRASNNKYMPLYDLSKPSSYLMYYDNNLWLGKVSTIFFLSYADEYLISTTCTKFWLYNHCVRFNRLHFRGGCGVLATSSWRAPTIRRARNHPASAMTNSSQHYAINSATSYIIEICSNSQPLYSKGSSYIAIRAISMTTWLHWT